LAFDRQAAAGCRQAAAGCAHTAAHTPFRQPAAACCRLQQPAGSLPADWRQPAGSLRSHFRSRSMFGEIPYTKTIKIYN